MKRYIISYTLITSLLLFFTGCQKETLLGHQPEKNPDTSTGSNRTLTLSAEMPDNGTSTRVALTQQGKQIDMTWEQGDLLQLCFVQGTTKIKREVTVNNISANGKKASFEIIIPDGIAEGQFDLYGVYGGEGLSESDPTQVLLPSNAAGAGSLSMVAEHKDAMLIFSSTGIQTTNPRVSVIFRHLGALFCITLKNVGTTPLEGLSSARLIGMMSGWAYNYSGGETYDLVNDVYNDSESLGSYFSFRAPVNTLSSGNSTSFWAWYPTPPVNLWPELRLVLMNGSNTSLAVSRNSRLARNSDLSAGKSYYFYALWDGEELAFCDSTFSTRKIEDLTLTGDLRHAVSGTNFLGMVYQRSGMVYYNEAKAVGLWSGEVALEAGSDPRLAVDSNNQPHVVYTTSDGKIAYRTRNGATWSNSVYIATNYSGVCSMPDIAVDRNRYAHITYTDTKGNTGDFEDHPDIMYAVNSGGSFVKTLIRNGRGLSSDHIYIDYHLFNKGSRIGVDALGQYYILTHLQQGYYMQGFSEYRYHIEAITANARGLTVGTQNYDVEDLFDMKFDGTNVVSFYKDNSVDRTSALSVNGTTIEFINQFDVSSEISNNYQNPATLLVNGGMRGMGCITTSNRVLTNYMGEIQVLDNVQVKAGTVVALLMMEGEAYIVCTDSGNTTRIFKR